MARRLVLTAALVAALLPVTGAGGATAQTPKRGGSVTFGQFFAEPACLNRLARQCNPGGQRQLAIVNIVDKVLLPAYEVGLDFTYRPALASATCTRKAPFMLTYRIRPEARWSDGVPITSRDFVFTHETRVARRDELADFERKELDYVTRVSAVDAKTVRVVLRSRYAGWRSLFGNILPAHVLRGQDLGRLWTEGIVDPRSGRPIGSGPFLVGPWQRGRQLTLVRNAHYWGPRARLDRIVLRFGDEEGTPSDWFRDGNLDVALLGPQPPALLAQLRQNRSARVVQSPSTQWEHFELRRGAGGHPALRLKPVRQAIAFGIDRAAIVREVIGEPSYPLLDSAVFLSRSRYYRGNWRRYEYRPAEARRLLERAGCRNGVDGIYSCAGERLSLRFLTTVGFPPRERTLSLVQSQLRRVGIEVEPQYATQGALFQILASGEFDVALFGWVRTTPDSSQKLIFGCGGELNYTGYCQRLVTADLDQADRILDARQRARVLHRIDVQLARDVPVIPLNEVPILRAYRSSLRNVDLSGYSPLANAEAWWLDD